MSDPILDAATGIANACRILPNLVTGGQPTPDHLEALQRAGVEVILDIRDPMEPRPLDEEAEVRRLGMEYINIPVNSGQADDATLERVLAVLRLHKDQEMVFHCNSGNRVGGALVAYLMLDRGMNEEEAIESGYHTKYPGQIPD
jgi:protein tyrosine phosphatase (PTP) superfamily phosphohydrolase (DUF442 family)